MTKLPVVYVAGPYRADNAWKVEQNVRAAEWRAYWLAENGIVPLCPHSMTRFFNGTLDPEFWLAATLELMRRCDAVLVVGRSYGTSEGTCGEIAEARRLGLPIFYEIADCGVADVKDMIPWADAWTRREVAK